MNSTTALGLALLPRKEEIVRIFSLVEVFEQTGSEFVFSLPQCADCLPHLSVMQAVFSEPDLAIAALDRLDKSKIAPLLSVTGLSLWATKILFLNLELADWLARLHCEAFHAWLPLSKGGSADPQSFQGISDGQKRSFEKTGYPFSLEEFLPHMTLAHFRTAPQLSVLDSFDVLLAESKLAAIAFEQLVLFHVEPLGICRKIVKRWAI